MRKLSRIFACILSAAIICSLFGCSNKLPDNEQIIGSADGKTNIIITENKDITETAKTTETSKPSTEDTTASVINITEEQAIDIAYKTLKETYSTDKINENGIDYTAFAFSNITLYDQDDDVFYKSIDTVKESGHSYYCIDYRNTEELCDISYYLIDAADGKVLHSGYMAD